MRKSLTYHRLPIAGTVIFFVLALFIYISMKTSLDHKGHTTGREILLMIIFLFSCLFFINSVFIFLQKRKIEFDDTSRYLTRNGTESIIPLKNIGKIEMTGNWMRLFNIWDDYRVTFTNNLSEPVYITSWIRNGILSNEMISFQGNVLRNNPAVEINDWTTNLEPWLNIFRKRK